MKKSMNIIIALVFSLIAHLTLAGEAGGLVEHSTMLTDRFNLPILPGLRRPARQLYSFSFASQLRLNTASLSDYAAREKRRSSESLDSFPAEQPANNLLRFRF